VEPDAAFRASLAERVPGLPATVLDALAIHCSELRRWNRRLALVGPGAEDELLERHYGESLAALPWLPASGGAALDLGSGAGFPGWVLAAAAPRFSWTLAEARARKAAFLRATAQRAGVALRVLDARVELPLPPQVPAALDVVTIRALRLDPAVTAALAARLRPGGRWLHWTTGEPPAVLATIADVPLSGHDRRLIVAAAR
jgi:16S rRNA (guanine527-N7)-methyltransferase